MYIVLENKKYEVKKCDTYKSRLLGIMFKKKKINKIYFFPKCNSIHTFFCFQNIDVVMTDKDNKIVMIKYNVPKNKIINYKKAYNTYEFPIGLILKYKIGDYLEIKNN